MRVFEWDADTDRRLTQLYNRKVTWRNIATELGCNVWQAEARADALGIRRPKPVGRQSAVLTVTVAPSTKEGIQELAERYGVTRSFLVNRMLEQGLRSAQKRITA